MKKLIIITLLLAVFVGGCTTKEEEDKTIKVGASPTPHALILEAARGELEALGYTLEIVEFTDYVLPNTSLDAGDLDANYFQHVPYLDYFNENNSTKLSSVLAVHFEPLGLYPGRATSLDDIVDGVQIAIPNDATNESRALRLLEDNGYISFEDNGIEEVTPLDIKVNPNNLTFVEMEAALIPQTLQDVDFAIINGNYALSAEVDDKLLLSEDKTSVAAQNYANVLVVQDDNINSEKTKALITVLSSSTIKTFIKDTFGNVVISVLP
jgi:D-methionine transport system substrate-binding protein